MTTSSNWFVNAAAVIRTTLSPHALLRQLLMIESHHGRHRQATYQGYQDRTLDLDLLLYDDQILESDRLVLPHPRLYERLFVLAPLAEIASDIIDPVTRLSIGVMHSRLRERLTNQILEQASWPALDQVRKGS